MLPRDEFSERNLIFTMPSVTVLSTLAMIFYRMIAQRIGSATAIGPHERCRLMTCRADAAPRCSR